MLAYGSRGMLSWAPENNYKDGLRPALILAPLKCAIGAFTGREPSGPARRTRRFTPVLRLDTGQLSQGRPLRAFRLQAAVLRERGGG